MARGVTATRTDTARTLLIVDDERSLRFSIREWAMDAGFQALEATGGREALERTREQSVDAVLLDLKLAGEDGLDVLKRLRQDDPDLPVIMLPGPGTVRHAVEATRLGAFDFMLKPPDLAHLGVVLERAMEHGRLKREVEEHRREKLQPLIGGSEGLQRALQRLEKAGRSSTATVLIHGETGSGKGLLA